MFQLLCFNEQHLVWSALRSSLSRCEKVPISDRSWIALRWERNGVDGNNGGTEKTVSLHDAEPRRTYGAAGAFRNGHIRRGVTQRYVWILRFTNVVHLNFGPSAELLYRLYATVYSLYSSAAVQVYLAAT